MDDDTIRSQVVIYCLLLFALGVIAFITNGLGVSTSTYWPSFYFLSRTVDKRQSVFPNIYLKLPRTLVTKQLKALIFQQYPVFIKFKLLLSVLSLGPNFMALLTAEFNAYVPHSPLTVSAEFLNMLS